MVCKWDLILGNTILKRQYGAMRERERERKRERERERERPAIHFSFPSPNSLVAGKCWKHKKLYNFYHN